MGVVTRAVCTATERTGTEQTDAEIISRMHGDPESFATIFDRYYPAIHGYAARRLGRDLADDVAAETFLVAFDNWRRYDTTYDRARPWLFGIASNLIAGHQRTEARQYRALARADQVTTADPDSVDGPADRVAVRLDAQAVRGRLAAALEDIAPADREVLLLIAWADLTCEEVARALEIPAGTVRSRLHRARKRLRAALGGADPTATGEEFQ
jgi:RNA polymerase sigma factor (sigma-70 family)